MRVIHLQMDAARTYSDVSFLERVLQMLDGVLKIATLTSLGLMSVMFDEDVTDPDELVRTARRAGLGVYQYRPAFV